MAEHDDGIPGNEIPDEPVAPAGSDRRLRILSQLRGRYHAVTGTPPLSSEEWSRILEEQQVAYEADLLDERLPELLESLNMRTATAWIRMAIAQAACASEGHPEIHRSIVTKMEDAEGAESVLGVIDGLAANIHNPECRTQLILLLDLLIDCCEGWNGESMEKALPKHVPGLMDELHSCATHYAVACNNYLVAGKFEDLRSVSWNMQDKPDALHGVEGGNADSTIYAIRNVRRNYNLRTQCDMYDDNPIAEPYFPIAPNIAGHYTRGAIRSICFIPKGFNGMALQNFAEQPGQREFQDDIGRWFYPAMTEVQAHRGDRRLDVQTQDLHKLTVLQQLQRRCTDAGREFLIDIDAINPEERHPLIVSECVNHNIHALRTVKKNSDAVGQWLSGEELIKEVYPDGEVGMETHVQWYAMMSLATRKKIESDFGIDIAQWNLWVQRAFLEWLNTVDRQRIPDIKAFLAGGNTHDRLIVLTAARDDAALYDILLSIGTMPDGDLLFHAYAECIRSATAATDRVHQWSAASGSSVSWQMIFQRMLTRANLLLRQGQETLLYGEEEGRNDLEELLERFRREGEVQAAAQSFFEQQITLLKQETDLSLRACVNVQRFIAQAVSYAEATPALLRSLERQGKLAHVPEIFWEVDRPAAQYRRRLGIDLLECLRLWGDPAAQKTLVEFGPGNGTFSQERSRDPVIRNTYVNLGICDKLYYPLIPLIRKMIDWHALEEACGSALDEPAREQFSDFLYKVLVLQPGTGHFKHLVYDQTVRREIDKNAASVLDHIVAKAPSLLKTDSVPSVLCGRDEEGGVVYPHQITRPTTGPLARALECFAGSPREYLRADTDVYACIPAYPPGVLLSDFGDIRNVRNNDIDIAIGLRSTVYVRGQHYIDFIRTMANKLSHDGFYIDDNVRDNDGWYYRIAELLEARRTIDPEMQIRIVVGPAIEKEDHYQGHLGVPLALIMTRDHTKLADVERQIREQPVDERTKAGYRLLTLDEIAAGDYLKLLDTSGRTNTSASAVLQRLGA